MAFVAVISHPACNAYCLQHVIDDFMIRPSSSVEVSPVGPVSPLGPRSPFSPRAPVNQTKYKPDVKMSVGLEQGCQIQKTY